MNGRGTIILIFPIIAIVLWSILAVRAYFRSDIVSAILNTLLAIVWGVWGYWMRDHLKKSEGR
ncbi:hypothetical protein DRP05_04220 [Archaeoglobales archaeon]|nr:MAG: hypothetical protein DRP05_04220 [Archaeoglobales archaeon]